MRKVLILSFIFFVLFVYWLVLSQLQISVVPEELEPSNYAGFYDYRGVTNVHTSRGMGDGTPAEVIRAAQEDGLDYIFITDLNVFNTAPVPEGYHRQLLVMNAEEYSYLDSRLLLYDRLRKHHLDSIGEAQTVLADLLSQSGADAEPDLIVLAHPSAPGFTWSGAYPSGLDGLEVINLKSIWQRSWNETKLSFIWSAMVYPFNPQFALLRLYQEPQEELDLWDHLSITRPTIGMAGSEATARGGWAAFLGLIGGNGQMRFPSYQRSFSLLTNHVLLRSELTGEAENDRRKILTAFSDGQFYMAIDAFGNPKGFAAFIREGEKIVPMGAQTRWVNGMKLSVHIPRQPKVPFETKLIKDGQEVTTTNTLDSEFDLKGKGTYRVIVRVFPTLTLPDGQRWMTWIYSNPFYVR